MRIITIRELKAKLSAYPSGVADPDGSIIVTSRGKPIAVIAAYTEKPPATSHQLPATSHQPSATSLTEDEILLLQLLVRGWSNDEIAHTLSVCSKTIERRLSQMYGRAEVDNRLELAIWAVRNGLA